MYGRQRMFGSLGWGIAIFIVATILGKRASFPLLHGYRTRRDDSTNLLDQSKSLTFYACGTSGPLEKNYTVCFAAFSVCMTFALITATRFEFTYESNEQVPLKTLNKDLKRTVYPTSQQYNPATNFNDPPTSYTLSSTMKLMQLVQVFMTLKNGTFLFIAW